AEIVQAEEVFLVAEAERPSALPFRRGWRRQLLADHPQRQELVALEQQDRPQALDILLAEQAVAALRASPGEQPPVLEVADLRDRDVGDLRLQPPAHGADRQEPALGARLAGRSRHRRRKVKRYLPIWSSSPSERRPDSMRRRLRNVPLRLPRSSTKR